jgi:hypothetical protein
MANEESPLVTNDMLDYNVLLKKFSWLIQRDHKTIISPDVDGILCGLLMSHYFDWKIVGFYDGKDLALKKGMDAKNCIFLDMDIFRKDIRSCAHHMVLYNKNQTPTNWDNYSNCVNPNNIRSFDALHTFQKKYPFATIHFLLCTLGCSGRLKIDLPKSAIEVLLYVDGTFKNLLNYPENCEDWLKFLNAKNKNSPIYRPFLKFATRRMIDMFHGLERMFDLFKQIAGGKKRGGDKIRISNIKDGSFTQDYFERIDRLIGSLAELTQWAYIKKNWNIASFHVHHLPKKIKKKTTGKSYGRILANTPFSLAITSAKRVEYTRDIDNVFG